MSKSLVIEILMNAQDKASAAFSRIKAASMGLTKELSKAQEELKDLARAQKAVADRAALSGKINQTTREIVENRKAAAALAAEIKRGGTATKAQAAQLQKLADSGERLKSKQAQQTASLETLNAKLRQHGITARDSAAAQAELDRRTAAATAKMVRQTAAAERAANRQNAIGTARDAAGRLRGGAAAGMAAGMAAGGLAVKAVGAGMSEEDAMLGVIRQVQGLKNANGRLNFKEIAAVRAEIQGLSRELPVATTDIMAMYEAGARMNVPRQELAAYVKTAASAATAFDAEDMGALAENLGRINANFKLSAEKGRELADVINYLDDNAISKGDAIIEYMNRVSGSMGLAKISEKNVAALGSTLLSQGVDESTAAGAVSSLFTRLSTAPNMAPVKKALQGLGLDAQAVQKGMVEDANATVMQIIEAVKRMPKEEQAGFLKGLAGGEYNKVFAGLISNTEEWRRQLELANSSDAIGSMSREFETRMTAFSSKWQVFKNQLFNAGAAAGQSLFPVLSGLMGAVGGWLTRLAAWQAANPQLAAGIMKVVAGAGALLVGLSTLAMGVSAVLVPMVMAKFAVLSLGSSALSAFGMVKNGLMILRAAMAANPVLLFAMLAVGALLLLWRNWDRVKNALISGWNYIKTVFRQNPLLGAFTGPIGAIASLIANFDRLKAAAKTAWDWVKKAVSGGGATPASIGVPNRGFSVGGYTGSGGASQPAGIVHAGEVVFSQSDVARFGGWRAVEALRRGGLAALNWGRAKIDAVAGYAARPSESPRRAPVLAGAVPVPASFGAAPSAAAPFNVNITISGGSQSAQEIAREVARQLSELARSQARRARSAFTDKD